MENVLLLPLMFLALLGANKKDLVAQVSFISCKVRFEFMTARVLDELIVPVRGHVASPQSLAQSACRRY